MWTVTLVLCLFAIAAGLGGRLVKAGGLKTEGSLEALLFWTATGFGALATAIVAAGLVFGVRPLVLLTVSAGAAFLGRNELRQMPSLVADALSHLRADAGRFSISIFLLIAVFLTTRALAPPVDWDALMYHLRAPQLFLEAGAIYRPEDNAHFGFVGLPHMAYLSLLAAGSPAGPALVSACFTLGLALAGFALGARFLDRRTAGLSLAVLWGSTILLLVAITPRIDTILAFYLLLIHYALLRSKESHDPRFLYVGAVLAGMAIGVKYNALIYLAALAPLGLWVVVRLPKPSVAVPLTLGFALATALPWLVKNGLLLGDPLYPFLGGQRLDPWLARLSGGDASSSLPDPALLDAVWEAQLPFNLIDLFVAPARITVEAEGRFYGPNLILLLLPLGLLFWRTEVLIWLAGPALAYAALLVLLQPSTNLRYLIPAVAPLTLVALYAYGRALDKVLSPDRVRFALSVTAVLTLANAASLMYRHLINGKQVAYVLGAVSRHAFLQAWTADYADVVAFVNERLPKQSRVLMLFEARGYYFLVPVIQDNVLMNWPVLSSKADMRDCLRSTEITHVLLNKSALQYYERRGLNTAPFRLGAFEEFARDCLNPIYSSSGFTVFEVRRTLHVRNAP